MRRAAAFVLPPLVAACGSEARDPEASSEEPPPEVPTAMPTAVPVPGEPVTNLRAAAGEPVSAVTGGAVTRGRFLGREATKAHRSARTPGPGGDWWSVSGRGTDHSSPPPCRTRARAAVTLAALLLAATACSSDADDPDRATHAATKPARSEPTIPEPVIVMDVDRPELCLGPIAESYPPQCGGPVINNWSWADHEGEYDQVGEVRWGEFMIEGHYEGDEFVVTSAVAVEHS